MHTYTCHGLRIKLNFDGQTSIILRLVQFQLEENALTRKQGKKWKDRECEQDEVNDNNINVIADVMAFCDVNKELL